MGEPIPFACTDSQSNPSPTPIRREGLFIPHEVKARLLTVGIWAAFFTACGVFWAGLVQVARWVW